MLVRFDVERFPMLAAQKRVSNSGARYISADARRAGTLRCMALVHVLLRLAEDNAALPENEAALARHMGGAWTQKRVRLVLNALGDMGEIAEARNEKPSGGWALKLTMNRLVLRSERFPKGLPV